MVAVRLSTECAYPEGTMRQSPGAWLSSTAYRAGSGTAATSGSSNPSSAVAAGDRRSHRFVPDSRRFQAMVYIVSDIDYILC
jgi:hypothetical protein